MRLSSILAAAFLAAAVLPTSAKSPKRGVSENEFQFKAQMAAVAPGTTWFYNWGPSVGGYLANETYMEFVPMCWNGNYDAAKIRDYVGKHPEVKYLLGFNEPNFTAQANMTPAAAAAQWGGVRALADELGLQLVAPALNYSPNPPYQDPVKWMDEFVAIVGEDAFDYLAVHSYGGFGVMKELATKFHEKYNKPVWVTEFCYWPEEGNPNSTVAPDAQISVMMQSLEWLEETPWIYRYAWFKPVGKSSESVGPNFGLLLSGKGEDPRELSEQGKVYVNLWNFDPECYHAANEWFPAAEYSSQYGALVGSYAVGTSENTSAIEVSRFNGGAWMEYQIDVPKPGEYKLELRVSGMGEPKRYDPSLTIQSVDADGEVSGTLAEARQFTLPNSDDTYVTELFSLTLPSGKQTIRIADANAARPSGLRFAAVKISDGSGVTAIAADGSKLTDVYTTTGVCVRRAVRVEEAFDGLPSGIYIAGGKKVVK